MGSRSEVLGLPSKTVRTRTCSEHPGISMHHQPRERHSQEPPAAAAAPQGACTGNNRLRAAWGKTTSAKASFHSRERKERAGRESNWSLAPRATAPVWGTGSRAGTGPSINHRPAAGPNPARGGVGAGDYGGDPLGVLMVLSQGISSTSRRRTRAAGDAPAEQGVVGLWPHCTC